MDQEHLRREMQRAAEVIIRTNRSKNAVGFPNSNARAPFEATSVIRKRRDAFLATSIMLLIAYIAGEGGPMEELGWFIPATGLLAVACLGMAFALEVFSRRRYSEGSRHF